MSPFDGESPTTTVHVTAELIAKADREHCPVELALADAGFTEPWVGQRHWANDYGWYPLPLEVSDFTRRFDNHEHVEPFTFTVPCRPTQEAPR